MCFMERFGKFLTIHERYQHFTLGELMEAYRWGKVGLKKSLFTFALCVFLNNL